MSDSGCYIRGADHVCLFSRKDDWEDISGFWESLGLTSRETYITDSSHDHVGIGTRLQVFAGPRLVVSYYPVQYASSFIDTVMPLLHVALAMEPSGLLSARRHSAFDRETHWGHSKTSVFLTGPYGLNVELVTTNPDFFKD